MYQSNILFSGPHRNSNASFAPSSFQSFRSSKSRKRVRLSSPASLHEQFRQANPQSNLTSSRNSSSRSITSNHPNNSKSSLPRPRSRVSVGKTSRTSRPVSGVSAGTAANPERRSLSQASIPLSAILSPRAPSVDALSTFHMRDPQKPAAREDRKAHV